MYNLLIANSKAKKVLEKYVQEREDVKRKLEKLKQNPRSNIGAHPLHGRLKGKWSC